MEKSLYDYIGISILAIGGTFILYRILYIIPVEYFIVGTLYLILYSFCLIKTSEGFHKVLRDYGGSIAAISVLITLALFFIIVERENRMRFADIVEERAKTALVINFDNGRNLQIATDILEDRKNEWIFWWDFNVYSYQNNWDYIKQVYNKNCLDEFQSVVSNMEVANNIMHSQRRLKDIIEYDRIKLSLIVKEHKSRIEHLKKTATDIKVGIEKINKADCQQDIID